jgi:hypothetical protein
MNIYTVFVGFPGTGKSSAIQHGCLEPMTELLADENSRILVKHIATKESAFLVSPEIFDVLNKLLKNDDENGSSDAMLLCKLFSGEPHC